jgi:hypothetical protein
MAAEDASKSMSETLPVPASANGSQEVERVWVMCISKHILRYIYKNPLVKHFRYSSINKRRNGRDE